MAESAVDVAARALARRDRSEADVRRILARKGVAESDADEALETLRRTGALDDERFAAATAQTLAARGYGDRAIVFRLGREGIDRESAVEAVSLLRPEPERAAALVERKGVSPQTERWLLGRGFARESIDHAVPAVAETAASELG